MISLTTQCREGEGVCPDTEHSSGRCTNDIISGSVEGSQEDGIQCISFEKPFTTRKLAKLTSL